MDELTVGHLFDWKDNNVVIFKADNIIGSALGHAFAYYQANVVLIDENADAMQNMHEIIKNMGGKSLTYGINISEEEQVASVVQDIVEHLGTIDILVNLSHADTLPIIQKIGEVMKRQRFGKIVNAVPKVLTGDGEDVVSHTKLDDRTMELIRLLAREYSPFGVNVNGVGRVRHAYSQTIPNQYIEPPDVVGAYLFLASAGADYITGQILYLHDLSIAVDPELG